MNQYEPESFRPSQRRGDQIQPEPDRDKVTATGRWIKRDKDLHHCDKPTYVQSPGVKTGDVWECSTCHKVWMVSGARSGGGYGPTQLTWVINIRMTYKND